MNGGAVVGDSEGTGRNNDSLHGRYDGGIKKLLESFCSECLKYEGK